MNVAQGTKVTATNKDSATHTWTAEGGQWNSGNLSQGGTFTFQIMEAGTFKYRCNIHPSMTGVVNVG